ncbi:DUF2927 domain-containing protein [Wenxinia marina]|uniref:Wenxma_18, whole genome shotgun sequence n=1 Tax=Wenxinia marina DSM 24838 TaxID=1123501 RepID=A0A0D0QA05_9RHOB|nr:DUF2927 domain-containing protein [Wenxinia marina]KIQ67843.1 hypothetical protein Wenmar_03572 [Wenxinia marina DSM 24838]GGL74604.1 hypothetical protein GCM10011392_31550 [Wenxinia marina]
MSRAQPAELALPPMRMPTGRTAPPPMRPNVEMARDILDLAFRMESGRTVPVLTRFEGPVTVTLSGAPSPALRHDLAALVARLRTEAGIDIRPVDGRVAAITVVAVPKAELVRAVPGAACFTVPNVRSWGEYLALRNAPVIDWTLLRQRTRAAIFLPADEAPQEVRDCLHEELAQALGPPNDLYRLPDSVFNDDNIHTILTGFDMLVLRALYAPELRSGMSEGEVAARLPAVLARLNPGGERPGALPRDASAAWLDAMRTALGTGSGPARRAAAARAAELAAGTTGPERGFSLYVLGRLTVGRDPGAAMAVLAEARTLFAARPETRLHEAHVLLHLAADALGRGDAARALDLATSGIPAAEAHENAALMSSLMMVRAEALQAMGQRSDAAAVRLDSLGWARYGFGPDAAVRDRLAEIAGLSPPPEGPVR